MNCESDTRVTASFRRGFAIAAALVVTMALTLPTVGAPRSSMIPSDAPSGLAVDGDPVDLSTGLYVRRSIDLALPGEAPVIFSRTYRNRDPRSRPFGIGTNHSYGTFLVGDVEKLSYVDLILADGGRVHYRRLDGGIGVRGAVFEHTTTPSEYQRSKLSWNGNGWTVQLQNGAIYTWPDCPPGFHKPCTLSSYRDAQGRETQLRHDSRMNMVQIRSASGATIDLTYDDADRIVLARSSDGEEVRYEYDALGRLVAVRGAEGLRATYTYDAEHQMIQLVEPGVTIENGFDRAGRCTRNDVRLTEGTLPGRVTRRQLFRFDYTVNSTGRITAVDVVRPTTKRRVTFNASGYVTSDSVEGGRKPEFGTAYERESESNVVRRIAVWCGKRRVSLDVDPDWPVDRLKGALQGVCRGDRP